MAVTKIKRDQVEDFELNERKFIPERIDSEELKTVSGFESAGWYVIAELSGAGVYSAEFTITTDGWYDENITFRVNGSTGLLLKRRNIKVINCGGTGAAYSHIAIKSVAIVDSATSNAGAYVVVYLDTYSKTIDLTIQMVNNTTNSTNEGLVLVDTPYLVSEPITLPDETTTGEIFEAGSKFSFDNNPSTIFASNWIGRVVDSDNILCHFLWDEVLKKGNGMTITLPTTSLSAIDYTGTSAVISSSHLVTSVRYDRNSVYFNINETGAFSTLTVGSYCFFEIAGDGCEIEITGYLNGYTASMS